jgi:hypothetical protein
VEIVSFNQISIKRRNKELFAFEKYLARSCQYENLTLLEYLLTYKIDRLTKSEKTSNSDQNGYRVLKRDVPAFIKYNKALFNP